MNVNDAVEILSTTYLSLDVVARTLSVDAAQVDAALKEAEAGSVEEVCLQYLAKYNPYVPPKAK